MTLFLRVLEQADKEAALREAVQHGSDSFEVDPSSFAQVPGSPFAYWVSDRIRRLFKELPPFEGEGRTVRVGLQTSDDFRFVRAWWEIPESGFRVKWFPFAKGGAYSPFYADIHLVVNWEESGKEMDAFPGSVIRNPNFYFRPGLTWPPRTQSGLSFRAMPSGCVFGHKGPAAFLQDDNHEGLASLLAITASTSFRRLVDLHMAFGSYEVGVIQRTPVPWIDQDLLSTATEDARRVVQLKQTAGSLDETDHVFILPSSMHECAPTSLVSFENEEIANLQAEIDDICFKLYGIEGEDRKQIEEWAGRSGQRSEVSGQKEVVSGQQEEGEEEEAAEGAGSTDELSALLSWAVGVAFGRFDIRLATGERQPPPDPDPFDPIPKRSPGMVPEGDPVFRANNGIYVDDPGHPDDLTACVRSVLERVSQPVPDTLRQWLARDFFSLHIRMYSKSRRKAPIYWQLATPSGSYSVWFYIHAFTADTLFRVQNDYIAPKLEHELRRLDSLRSGMPETPKATERKALASQETLVQELKDLLAEVRLVAPLWAPDLDDGVVINSAPLWRLFPQNKAWQREVNAVWDTLCTGRYDWSHLAIRLWPERVVPKCATDRSLAIAHGLEDVFWVEGSDGKWVKRATPTRPVDELVEERSSAAVGSALSQLLSAPGAGTQGGRGMKRPKGNGKA